MNIFMALYMLLLFVILTPSMFLRIPSSGSKTTVSFVHGALFVFVWWLTHKWVWITTERIMN